MLALQFLLAGLPLILAQYGDPSNTDSTSASASSSESSGENTATLTSAEGTLTAGAGAPLATGALPTNGTAVVHNVTVGLGGLVFNPTNITAAVGDQILFTYYPKNHSVSQSSFATPCYHLADANGNAVGIDSGFAPVAPDATLNPTFQITIEQTTPLWFYCAQGNHCTSGMVFAVNAPTTGNTVDQFLLNAKNVTATPAGNTSVIPVSVRTSASAVVASTVSGVASGGGSGATSTGSQSTGSATATGSSGSPTATNKSAASTLEVVSVLLFITFGATAFAL